jgi:hypothetical protein
MSVGLLSKAGDVISRLNFMIFGCIWPEGRIPGREEKPSPVQSGIFKVKANPV